MDQRTKGQIAASGVLGTSVLAIGLLAIPSVTGRVLLILPTAALIGGLVWSADATPRQRATRPLPADTAPPRAFHASIASSREPTGSSSSADHAAVERLDAARTFVLQDCLVDELPDRLQCASCGRYANLRAGEGRSVTCITCGGHQPIGAVQPDTLVRMFVPDADDRAAPTSNSE